MGGGGGGGVKRKWEKMQKTKQKQTEKIPAKQIGRQTNKETYITVSMSKY